MKWNLPSVCRARPSCSGQAESALISLLRPWEPPDCRLRDCARLKTALGNELWGASTLALQELFFLEQNLRLYYRGKQEVRN